MAETTVTNGQTCLEKRGFEQRTIERVRRHYNEEDPYGANHPDALAYNNDPQGKGSGHGGHTFWLPDCNKPTGLFDYSNFDTNPNLNIGGQYDIEGREGHPGRREMMARSIYNADNQYGAALVNTALNVADGQIQLDY